MDRLNQPEQAAKYALRELGRRVEDLTAQINAADKHLHRLLHAIAPTVMARPQVGPVSAAQLLITAGENIERFPSEAAFARLCGVAPVPVSSGKSHRMRLHRGGNRQANRVIYLITVGRLKVDPKSQAYRDRKISQGHSKSDVIRSLKRYVARELYYALKNDLSQYNTPLAGRRSVAG